MLNPSVYEWLQLQLMSEKDILIAIYQLHLSAISLLFSLLFFGLMFLFLKWILPKYWYKSKEIK